MPDKYRNFADLARSERNDAYRIHARHVGPVLVLAPHGGGIEPGTSELGAAISGDDFSLYLFEGRKLEHNGDLHVTSSHFDEPQAVAAVRNCEMVVAIHGEESETKIVYVGGLDRIARDRITATLRANGFDARYTNQPHLAGESPHNICNRGRSGAGVQLEIAAGLRRSFFRALSPRTQRQHTTDAFHRFVEAVRAGILVTE
jgi:phage replication-related protein YjqB (UPF0714/DUF867 family)